MGKSYSFFQEKVWINLPCSCVFTQIQEVYFKNYLAKKHIQLVKHIFNNFMVGLLYNSWLAIVIVTIKVSRKQYCKPAQRIQFILIFGLGITSIH